MLYVFELNIALCIKFKNDKTSTLGTWRPIVFNALRLMNNVQMTKIC